ncbi:MAG: aspartate ammonia-lyase [Clostridiaceae bacterium]|nr:aspartate ammonia-lyase [Clostridiaceae bacterium]
MTHSTDTRMRIERDSIGTIEVPADAYYGANSLRAAQNFPITGMHMHPEVINSMCQIKKAAALTNLDVGRLGQDRVDAIVQACDEIMAGKLHDQFIVDPIQGGAGTSLNMNANEVIANRAIEILGGTLGDYDLINPNDHVNYAQSTNDVFPSSGRITAYKLLLGAETELKRLQAALLEKAEEFDDVIKMGRTQMQDAVPIRLGQEFAAWSFAIGRDLRRFENARQDMRFLNLGGTAIGTGINADVEYLEAVIVRLAEITGLPLTQADNLIDGTQNTDGYVAASSAVKTCAVNLSKISNDLRLMSSGPRTGFGEIKLPEKQAGSSIMPGKVNPVIPEVVNQVCFNIIGNDVTVTMAAEAGQLELNAFEPIIFYNLFQSIETLKYAVRTLVDNCIVGITANRDHCHDLVYNSVGIITAVVPHLGYRTAATVAKEAIKTGKPIREIILRDGLLTEAELDKVLDPYAMTEPGVCDLS